MALEERFSRLETKFDKLQDQVHQNHLELLQCFSKVKNDTDEEIGAINLKLKEHDGHFSMVTKLLGLGSIIGGWLGLRDLWPHK